MEAIFNSNNSKALQQANAILEKSPVVLFRWKAVEGWPVELVSNNVTQFGYAANDLLSGLIPYSSIVHPDDLEQVVREVEQFSLDDVNDFHQEYRLVSPTGEVFWIDDRTIVERDSDGNVTHYQGVILDITERRKNDYRFRSVLDASPVPFALNDGNKITHLNAAFTDTFGYTLEDIPTLEEWWPKAYPDEEYRNWVATTWQEHLEKAQTTGSPFEPIELRILSKSGEYKNIIAHASPLTENFQGSHLIVLYDITDHKRAEEANKEGLQRLLTASTEGLYLHQHGIIKDVNDTMLEITGYTRDQLIGSNVFDLITAESLEYARASATAIDKKAFDAWVRYANGDKRLVTNYPKEVIVNDETYGLVAFRDITDQAAMEQKLRENHEELLESEKRLNRFFHGSHEGLFYHLDGVVIDVNPAVCEMLGYQRDEAIGRNLLDFAAPDSIDLITKKMKAGLLEPYEAQVRHRSGEKRHVIIRAQHINIDDKQYRLISLQDVTEIKQTQVNLEQAKRELEQQRGALETALVDVQKASQAKSDFLSSMSHELRTPLNAILGFSQLLQLDEGKLNQVQIDNVGEIHQAGEHLLALINEVLGLAKIEAGQIDLSIEPIALKDTIEECLSLTTPLAQKNNIHINVDAASCNKAVVRADAMRLKQVFLNLLSNAIKYNCQNGQINIYCQYKPDDRVCINVEDTGIGISQENQQHLFSSFNRLGAEQTDIEGTGIGLVITKNIVELMGGHIEVESEQGKGSIFSVTLPGDEILAVDNEELKTVDTN